MSIFSPATNGSRFREKVGLRYAAGKNESRWKEASRFFRSPGFLLLGEGKGAQGGVPGLSRSSGLFRFPTKQEKPGRPDKPDPRAVKCLHPWVSRHQLDRNLGLAISQ